MNQDLTINSKQIQFIQVQRRTLGISDDVYAEMKKSVGVKSTRDLTNRQFDDLLRRMNGSILHRSARTCMTVGGDEIRRMEQNGASRPPYKRVHHSAYRSGMHTRPAPDREAMIRKIEAILADQKLPWSYVDGMAGKMFSTDAFRFCDAEQTRKILQALCVYQKRRQRPDDGAGRKPAAGDEKHDLGFYVRELKSEECSCGKSKKPGRSFCWSCWKLLPAELQNPLYRRMGAGYEEAYEAAAAHLDKVRHQYGE